MNDISTSEYVIADRAASGKIRLRVFEDPQSLASAAARFILCRIKNHQGKHRFRIALSGGRTPSLMYAALASNPDSVSLLNEKAEFFFSDERAVGPDDKDSNYGSANRGLFEPLGVSERIIHRMKGEATDLTAEAERYTRLISSGSVSTKTPSLDLTILGMGPDGHTASLFPDHDISTDGDPLILAPWVESKKSYRLSFSLSLINASAQVLFLVTGSDKAAVLGAIIGQSSADYPASRVRAKSTLWMVDKSAASELNLHSFKLAAS